MTDDTRPETDPEMKKADQSFRWVDPDEGTFEAYSNYILVNWTTTDTLIRFGQLVPSEDSRTWEIAERAAITLSWNHAKYLGDLLGRLIKAYEEKNGDLRFPEMPQLPAETKEG